MWILLGILLGLVVVLGTVFIQKRSIEQAKLEETKLFAEAEEESRHILEDAKIKAKENEKQSIEEIRLREEHIAMIEKRLNGKNNQLNERIQRFEASKKTLQDEQQNIIETKEKIIHLNEEQIEALAKKTDIPSDQIKEKLLEEFTHQVIEENNDLVTKYGEIEHEAGEKRSSEIIKLAIQRYSAETSREQVATTVNFKNKKNITRVMGDSEEKYLEKMNLKLATDLAYEWDGHTLEIYGHDLLKRNLLKLMLTNLMKNPKLDEDAALKLAKETIGADLIKHGKTAINQLGLKNIPDQLVKLIGRLYYRTSFGQNILKHSVEVGYLAEMLAAEIGADTEIAKLGGLLHDIGKAIDTEIAGAHDAIGKDIAVKFNMPEPIINAIYAHHEAEPFKYVESRIVQVADAISASRPGARHQETLEDYLERIEKLESITANFAGIEKSYAISAGRELRVLVDPDELTDDDAKKLTQDIAKKIEEELTYPGEIKINLIREKKVIDFAN